MKTCTKCGEAKAVSDFYARHGKPNAACKECDKARARLYHVENREAQSARMEQWRKANPQRRAENKRAYMDRLLADEQRREEFNLRRRQLKTSESAKATRRERRKRRYWEDESFRAAERDRNERYRAKTPEDTQINRYDIYERDNGICRLCGEPVSRDNFHLDHIVPRSLGGVHRPENIQIAHPACNQRKCDRLEGQISLPV